MHRLLAWQDTMSRRFGAGGYGEARGNASTIRWDDGENNYSMWKLEMEDATAIGMDHNLYQRQGP
jgi:hypothetical protein